MKILSPGGSGQVGLVLARGLMPLGHEVVVLTRGHAGEVAGIRHVHWDARTHDGAWTSELADSHVVINLAGRSVNCRYNVANRRAIMDSRLDSTRAIGRAISACPTPPRLWLQASTATIYAHRFDAANDEPTGILGGDEPDAPDTWRFSINVARAWEAAAAETATPGTRLVLLRSAMTMSPDPGGVFDTLMWLVRRGLGGTNASGRQYVSWIHEEDFVRAVEFLINRDDIAGPVNLASPAPLPNRDFMAALRRAAGVAIGLPATRWMLEIGALLLRTETELILKSRRVVPKRLEEAGFTFTHPTWPQAAADLVKRWRARRSNPTTSASPAMPHGHAP